MRLRGCLQIAESSSARVRKRPPLHEPATRSVSWKRPPLPSPLLPRRRGRRFLRQVLTLLHTGPGLEPIEIGVRLGRKFGYPGAFYRNNCLRHDPAMGLNVAIGEGKIAA